MYMYTSFTLRSRSIPSKNLLQYVLMNDSKSQSDSDLLI